MGKTVYISVMVMTLNHKFVLNRTKSKYILHTTSPFKKNVVFNAENENGGVKILTGTSQKLNHYINSSLRFKHFKSLFIVVEGLWLTEYKTQNVMS